MSDFNAKFPLHIRFCDFDSLGHVNNADFLSYMEDARVNYFEKLLDGKEVDWWQDGIILGRVEIDFKKPITGFHHYFISIRCSRIGNKSFDFAYLITHEENNSIETIAEAKSVMVCYDYANKITVPVYEDWIEKMEKFEGKKLRS